MRSRAVSSTWHVACSDTEQLQQQAACSVVPAMHGVRMRCACREFDTQVDNSQNYSSILQSQVLHGMKCCSQNQQEDGPFPPRRNWVIVILLRSVSCVAYVITLPSMHQFITNPANIDDQVYFHWISYIPSSWQSWCANKYWAPMICALYRVFYLLYMQW